MEPSGIAPDPRRLQRRASTWLAWIPFSLGVDLCVIEYMSTVLKEYKKLDTQGKNRLYVDFVCDQCGKVHHKQKRQMKHEHNYCSRECVHLARQNRVTCECANCGKAFQKRPSSLRNSKSGLFFCCRECKDSAQKIGGITDIMPPHYGNGKANYRDIAFREMPRQCSRCGYDEYPQIIQVHHKDGDRNNNDIINLEPLCPNCHAIEHRVKLVEDDGNAP